MTSIGKQAEIDNPVFIELITDPHIRSVDGLSATGG